MKKNHQFHLVDPSPWPILSSFILMATALNAAFMLNTKNSFWWTMSTITLIWLMILWWRDIHRESTFQGNHTNSVTISMKYGMILFIMSEVWFFLSFFWSFFHHSLTPNPEIGLAWPPLGISPFNPLHIPLINTIILLSSGVSITWAHSAICMNNFYQTKNSLLITISLGIYFSMLQYYEYVEASFSVSDSIYGSSFFITTGFHGIHVIIGSLFIIHALTRMNFMHFSQTHHLGLEASIWYWHFVDVVWLFLYTSIYWWGK
uniref:Cytochrome c oxidase subunit 3 n=1 Tax=Agonoscena pistaciae TaxID=1635299 RepID=A0A8F2TCP1_9HEMI|nr:cytochrome c oxidase subunit 3 [Agonoscena pistaciae]